MVVRVICEWTLCLQVAPLAERKAFQAARQAKYEEALGAVAGDAAMQQPQLEEAGSLLDLESQSGRV